VPLDEEIRETNAWERGFRAEEVARFYLKLQGFFTLENFAVHEDRRSLDLSTEIDILAVRNRHSCEHIAGRRLQDCEKLSCILGSDNRSVLLIVEVKSSNCAVNPSWVWNPEQDDSFNNHLCAIKRAGFWPVSQARKIAEEIAKHGRWKDSEASAQFLCIGAQNGNTGGRPQIMFHDIADFLVKRFLPVLPVKIPERQGGLRSWGPFGYGAAECLKKLQEYHVDDPHWFRDSVERYVATGSFEARPRTF